MSYAAQEWARRQDHPDLQTVDAYLLDKLAYRANDFEFECWPAQKLLASEMKCSVRTVQRSVEKLVRLGLVEIRPLMENGRKVGNKYRLLLGEDPIWRKRRRIPEDESGHDSLSLPEGERKRQAEATSGSDTGGGSENTQEKHPGESPSLSATLRETTPAPADVAGHDPKKAAFDGAVEIGRWVEMSETASRKRVGEIARRVGNNWGVVEFAVRETIRNRPTGQDPFLYCERVAKNPPVEHSIDDCTTYPRIIEFGDAIAFVEKLPGAEKLNRRQVKALAMQAQLKPEKRHHPDLDFVGSPIPTVR